MNYAVRVAKPNCIELPTEGFCREFGFDSRR